MAISSTPFHVWPNFALERSAAPSSSDLAHRLGEFTARIGDQVSQARWISARTEDDVTNITHDDGWDFPLMPSLPAKKVSVRFRVVEPAKPIPIDWDDYE